MSSTRLHVLGALAVLVAVLLACKAPSGSSAIATTASAPAARVSLEKHLAPGSDWGEDPVASDVAKRASEILTGDFDKPRAGVSVVAKIVRSAPRNVVILGQVESFEKWSMADKKRLVAFVQNVVGFGLAPGDDVTLGVRDGGGYDLIAYGAIGSKDWQTIFATDADADPIDKALAATEVVLDAGARPAAKIGEAVTLPSGVVWTILDVKDRGKKVVGPTPSGDTKTVTAAGHFVVVHYRVELTGKAAAPGDAPRLVDAGGKTYEEGDAWPMIPANAESVDTANYVGRKTTFYASYDVDDGAKGLRAKLPGPELADPTFISLEPLR